MSRRIGVHMASPRYQKLLHMLVLGPNEVPSVVGPMPPALCGEPCLRMRRSSPLIGLRGKPRPSAHRPCGGVMRRGLVSADRGPDSNGGALSEQVPPWTLWIPPPPSRVALYLCAVLPSVDMGTAALRSGAPCTQAYRSHVGRVVGRRDLGRLGSYPNSRSDPRMLAASS